MEELENVDIQELDVEELVDVKIKIEESLMECEEILQNYDEENS